MRTAYRLRWHSLAFCLIGFWHDAESVLSVGGGEDDCVLGVLEHMARVDHLAEDLAGGLALIGLMLQHAHTGLQFVQLRQLPVGLRLIE